MKSLFTTTLSVLLIALLFTSCDKEPTYLETINTLEIQHKGTATYIDWIEITKCDGMAARVETMHTNGEYRQAILFDGIVCESAVADYYPTPDALVTQFNDMMQADGIAVSWNGWSRFKFDISNTGICSIEISTQDRWVTGCEITKKKQSEYKLHLN